MMDIFQEDSNLLRAKDGSTFPIQSQDDGVSFWLSSIQLRWKFSENTQKYVAFQNKEM